MTVVVVMLDLGDHTLHRPGPVHMRTACGVDLDNCTVGPRESVEQRAARRCPECWPVHVGDQPQ
jgi:hypothetical protein